MYSELNFPVTYLHELYAGNVKYFIFTYQIYIKTYLRKIFEVQWILLLLCKTWSKSYLMICSVIYNAFTTVNNVRIVKYTKWAWYATHDGNLLYKIKDITKIGIKRGELLSLNKDGNTKIQTNVGSKLN